MKYALYVFSLIWFCIGTANTVQAWPGDPTVHVPVCTADAQQFQLDMTAVDSGGVVIVWTDLRDYSSTSRDVYAQFVNAYGDVMWVPDGVAVCTVLHNQESPSVVSDGAGGVFIIWQDSRNIGGSTGRDIYAQRINAAGELQWTQGGIAICSALDHQQVPAMASDGAGGAIIAWYDYRSGEADIYAQRINGDGVDQWMNNGISICTAADLQYGIEIVADGFGGAVIAWRDDRSEVSDIYAQRVNALGAPQWSNDGVAICTEANEQFDMQLVSDGSGGAIISWRDERVAPYQYDIYAQRVNGSGTVEWTPDGIPVCLAPNYQIFPQIAADGAGGAFIVWQDSRPTPNSYDIYAQHLDTAGTEQWVSDGMAICTWPDSQGDPLVVPDGSGGAIISWGDYNGGIYHSYAQRYDASGVAQWTTGGVMLCEASGAQYESVIVSDDYSGAVIAWSDNRLGSEDIYCQRIYSDGALSGPDLPASGPMGIGILILLMSGLLGFGKLGRFH